MASRARHSRANNALTITESAPNFTNIKPRAVIRMNIQNMVLLLLGLKVNVNDHERGGRQVMSFPEAT